MIKIYVGDVTEDLCQAAQKESSNAILITSENCQCLEPGIYYLSLGDVSSISQFIHTLNQADELVYVPVDHWSDEKNNHSDMKKWTEFYLRGFDKCSKFTISDVSHLSQTKFLKLVDVRKTENSQLWIAGCSVTYGMGVEPDQRYGQIIANELNMPVSFLSFPGSSIEWAADQILRSDIRTGDIVVWGITSVVRFPFYHNNKVEHLNPRYYELIPEFNKIVDISRLDEEDLIYRSVTKIHQVLNYCNKIGARLCFAGLLVTPDFLPYLIDLPNYTQFFGHPEYVDKKHFFLDFGSDNLHPGKLTHEWYAKILLEKIRMLQ